LGAAYYLSVEAYSAALFSLHQCAEDILIAHAAANGSLHHAVFTRYISFAVSLAILTSSETRSS
jgi:hypothetical protein